MAKHIVYIPESMSLRRNGSQSAALHLKGNRSNNLKLRKLEIDVERRLRDAWHDFAKQYNSYWGIDNSQLDIQMTTIPVGSTECIAYGIGKTYITRTADDHYRIYRITGSGDEYTLAKGNLDTIHKWLKRHAYTPRHERMIAFHHFAAAVRQALEQIKPYDVQELENELANQHDTGYDT